MSSSVRNVEEFSRLFRVRIPLEKEFDYYISVLAQSPEFHWLEHAANGFAEFEKSIGEEDPGQIKMETVFRIKNLLSETEAFKNLRNAKLFTEPKQIREIQRHDQRYLIRLDIPSANYNVLKSFDNKGELSSSWNSYLNNHNVPEILRFSKSFRQLVFGYLGSRTIQQHQILFLHAVKRSLHTLLKTSFDAIVYSGDEIILIAGKNEEEAIKMFTKVDEHLRKILNSEVIPMPYRGVMSVNAELMKYEIIPNVHEAVVDHRFEVNNNKLNLAWKSLHAVPGSLFYLLFRHLIIGGEPQELDLLFRHENRLAKWVIS